MSGTVTSDARWRNNSFTRASGSLSPIPRARHSQSKSAVAMSPQDSNGNANYDRPKSFSPAGAPETVPFFLRGRSSSTRMSHQTSSTFAPTFIRTEDSLRECGRVNGIEGENDFSGKRYVWLRDTHSAFVKGFVVEECEGDQLLVQCDDGSVRALNIDSCNCIYLLRLATPSSCGCYRQSQSCEIRQSQRHGRAHSSERSVSSA